MLCIRGSVVRLHRPRELGQGGEAVQYVLTIHLKTGQKFTVRTRLLELAIMYVEGFYGEAIAHWDAAAL